MKRLSDCLARCRYYWNGRQRREAQGFRTHSKRKLKASKRKLKASKREPKASKRKLKASKHKLKGSKLKASKRQQTAKAKFQSSGIARGKCKNRNSKISKQWDCAQKVQEKAVCNRKSKISKQWNCAREM